MKIEEIWTKTELELQREIIMRSVEDPIIYTILHYYDTGAISWDKALMAMVLVLHESNKQLTANVVEAIRNSIVPTKITR